MDRFIDISCSESGIYSSCESADPQFKKSLKPCAYHIESQEEHNAHDHDESRDGGVLACEKSVDFLTPQAFFTFMRLSHRFSTDLLYECKTHIGNSRASVESALLFHLQNDMFDRFLFILIKV